jgi:hypothetical protein
MSLEKLQEAGDVLREAGESIEGAGSERLHEQADELSKLAERDQGPDHGHVARYQQKLRDIKEDEPDTADAVDEAIRLLNDYRETVEGV